MNWFNPWVNFDASFNGMNILDILNGSKAGRISHSTRLHEIEAAKAYGIAFDDNWYSIPTQTRAMMIAGTLVRTTLTNLEIKQARSKHG